MPNGDPRDGFFYLTLTLMIDYYFYFHRHNDLPERFRMYAKDKVYTVDLKEDTRKVWNTSHAHTDIPRLREGRLGAQV